MMKKKKLAILAGILFFVFLSMFWALGKNGSRKALSQVISYHADGNSIFGAVYDPFLRSYLIIQEDYRTGKEYGLRFPESRKSGEKYDLRYLQREDSGKVAVLFDIYGEGILLRSEVWICTPSEGRAEMIYEEEVSDGGEPIELFADSRGILLLHFESMGRGTDMTRVKRTMLYEGSYGAPVVLGELRLWNMSSMAYYASSNEGIWYSDRYGNVYYCAENGVTTYMLKNDGSRISINNVGYSPTRRGFYFYNLDQQKDYWIGIDGKMAEYENPALEEFRKDGYQVEALGIDREGIVYADLGDKEESWGLAVMVPGEESRILWSIGIPARQWLPGCLLAAAAATGVVLAGILMILYAYRHAKVIPVTVRIAAASILVLFAGGILVYAKTQDIFSERRRESVREILASAAVIEADKVDRTRFEGDQPDVNYFEQRSQEKESLTWKLSGLDSQEVKNIQMEYTMGYFRVLGEDAYPILGYDYVTTPARYTRSAGELALITLCMEKKQPIYGTYTEYGETHMAVYAPVLDGNGTLTGLVKTEKELGSVEQRASLDTRALTGAILSGVFLAAAAVILMIGLALRPLKQLSSFMDRLEEGAERGRLRIHGHNEISEMLRIFDRMGENIRDYLHKVQRLQERYGAFVPKDLVSLLGKEDIRQVGPGDAAVCEAAVVLINMDDFSGIRAANGAEELFRLINRGLEEMIPLADQYGGHIVRFLEGGLLMLFPGSAWSAAECTMKILERLEREEQVRYYGALDHRRVNLKVMGSHERMEFMIQGEDMEIVSGLWRLAAGSGIQALMSGSMARKIQEEADGSGTDSPRAEILFRALGSAETDGCPVEMYELSASWDESQYRLKRETMELFLQGISRLRSCQVRDARECFAEILRKNGSDMAARRYFDVCDGILTGEREPEDTGFGRI